MNSYEIRGNLLAWFKNFLHERKQKVVIRDSSSSLSNVFACVPQEYVCAIISYIGEKLLSLTRLFVDDTSFVYSISCSDTLELVINHDPIKIRILV